MSTDQGQRASSSGTLWGLPPVAEAFVPTSEQPPLPTTIGKYKVLGRLGDGAMGVVYKCSQPGLGRPVAVKVMVAGRHASAEQIRRFQREAWAAAQLTHPNVLQVYDVGSEGDLNYFVMEYVDGWSLDRLIGTPALTPVRSLRLLAQVARALQAAHAQGIIHRDIKPSNILIHRSGQPKLADFGLAKALHDGQNLSGSGDLIGTPRYMSPEQALAAPHEVDARSDVYSLGAVLYEMLTGRPPVDGPNVLAVLRQLSDEEPVPIRALNSAIPEEVAAICKKAMAKECAERYESAGAFAEAIERHLATRRAEERTHTAGTPRVRLVRLGGRATAGACATAGILLLSLVALWVWPGKPKDSGDREPSDPGTAAHEEEGLAAFPAPARPERRTGDLRTERPLDAGQRAAKAVALAREQLGGSLNRLGAATPRDRLRSIQENLTSVLIAFPSHQEARFLRARARRDAGEYLAAIEDLDRLLADDRSNLYAVVERLLANYQLHVLYFGNLNEPLLRPVRTERVKHDVRLLRDKGTVAQKYEARLVEALARLDYEEAGRIVEKGPPPKIPADDLPDILMLEADTLFHLAELAYATEMATEEGSPRETKRLHREELVRRANTALRRGLDADPNHVGLLFLKADTFQRRAVWDTAENEDRDTMLRRQRLAFETAVERLRHVTPLGGCDTAVARAVLLSNFGREGPALDRVHDALSCQPTVHYLHTLKAWLRLQAPPDGILTSEEVDRILRDFHPAFDTPPDDYSPYFIQALLLAVQGHWEQSIQDLRRCRYKLGKDKELPTAVPAYNTWFVQAAGPYTKYLDATLEVLWVLPAVPVDLRVRLPQEILARLADAGTVQQEGLKPDEVKRLKGWTHYRLARAYAGKNEKENVLRHLTEALDTRLADLKPQTCRDDGTFSAWNDDPAFKALYQKFEAH
jgi:tetratricopeptide (TPR) repeat protein/predicted Ser/Thr protein kinase